MYNSASYIRRTIESVVAQDVKALELILIDDGSDDGTLSEVNETVIRLSEQGQTNIKIIRTKHVGPGEARNIGIRAATGDWIAFLDSDDEWVNTKIKKVTEIIEREKEVNSIVHWELYIRLDGRENLIRNGSNLIPSASIGKVLYKKNCLSTSAMVIKKSLFKTCGLFDPHLSSSQDFELWLRMADHMKIAKIEEILGKYHELPTSISARPYYQRVSNLITIYWRHKGKVGLLGCLIKIFGAIMSRQWIVTIRNLISMRRGH